MKVTGFILLLIFSISSFAQNEAIFDPGVKLNSLDRADNYEVPVSILFQFEGDPELVEHFQNLESLIREQFKLTDIKLGFNYELLSTKQESEKLVLEQKMYNSVCILSLTNLEIWDNDYEDLRKQTYNLKLKMNSSSGKNELSGMFDVKTLNHISTENLKISEAILIAIASK